MISVRLRTSIASIIILLFFSCTEQETTTASNAITDPGNYLSREQIGLIHNSTKQFPHNTQLAFSFIHSDTVEFFGVIRMADSMVYVDNSDAIFEIGSISKVFTSTLLSNMVVENKVKLDEPVNPYLGFELKDSIQVTFEQLSNHTSGFPRMPSNFILGSLLNPGNPYKNYDMEKLEDYLSNSLELETNPGEKSAYSNLGVGLLAQVLSNISGRSYEEMLQSYIFDPYGMDNSTTVRKTVGDKLVRGLDEDGKVTPNWDLNSLIGAGGILSSTRDLSKFALAQFDPSNESLNLTRLKTFSVYKGMDVGLGWFILKDRGGWFWHNGGTGGYTTSMAIDTVNHNGVIILTNISAFHDDSGKIDDLCFELMNSLEK